jgi:catalase
MQSVMWNEAVKINGADPDFHRRDMWNTIDQGHPAEWELGMQLFDDEFADSFDFDVLDSTKLIPEELVPIRRVGRLVLEQNVDNFFAETEQIAFCTQNVVRGIDFTNDPLLQGRNFSYLDTQLKRLGSPNFTQIPVNAPRCPVMHFQRDGHMTISQPAGRVNYEPNSWSDGGPREHPEAGFKTFPDPTTGDKRRIRPESFADHFSQALQFYRSQTAIEQKHIADALVFELSKVQTPAIRSRVVGQLRNIDDGLTQEVAAGLGLDRLPDRIEAAAPTREVAPSPALSIIGNARGTFAGRRFGALISDGADAKTVRALRRAVDNANASLAFIAPTIDGISDSDGMAIEIDEAIDGGPSVLFDAVAIILTDKGAAELAARPSAADFVTDAHTHAKFVGVGPNATVLLDAAGIDDSKRDAGYLELRDTNKSAATLLDACADLRFWDREG